MIRNFSYKKNRAFLLLLMSSFISNVTLFGQVTMTFPGLLAASSSAGLGSATGYAVNENLFTDSEIGAGLGNSKLLSLRLRTNNGFPTTPVGNNIFNNVRISVKQVPATTLNMAAGVYSLTGYTTVFSGAVTVPSTAVTDITIPFSTPFPRTAGMNLMVMIERLDGVSHSSGNWQAVNHATISGSMARRYTGTSAPVLGTTNISNLFTARSVVGFSYDVLTPTVNLDHVYTLGKLPIPYGTPHTVQASVSNNSSSKAYNVKAYLAITGVNTFNDTITIDSINPYSRKVVSFKPFSPTNYGINTVTATITPPTGGFVTTSTFSMSQTVTTNSYSLAYGLVNGVAPQVGGVGFNGSTGDFVAKFFTDLPSKVNQVVVSINSATNGPQPFKVGIWGDNGSGAPGALLWESAQLASSAGNFTVPVIPKIALAANSNFFVGVRQLGTTNITFSYQPESPPRVGSMYYTFPSGSNTWADFSSTNSGYRFLAEAKLELVNPNDVGIGQILMPINGKISSVCDSVAPVAEVANFGTSNQTNVPVTLTISQGGTPIYSQSVIIPSLATNQVLAVTFPKFLFQSTGIYTTYTADATTFLVDDQDPSNDLGNITFGYGQFSYGTDKLAFPPTVPVLYNYANSTSCAAAAPSQPTYSWIPTTGLTQLALPSNADDIFTGAIQLPFTYYFFGKLVDKFWLSSNGFITFTDPSLFTNYSNNGTALDVPFPGGLENYIAGAMCDLDFTAANYPDAKIYYGQNPNNPNEFVITFWHAHRKYAVVPTIPEYVTFQIILTKNKNYPFKIQYNAAESTSPLATNITDLCTIGAENSDGTNGILYRRLSNFGTMFDKNNSLAFEAKLKDTTIVKLNAKVFLQNVDVVTGVMGDFFHAVNSFPLSDPYAVPGAFSGTFAHVNNGSIKTTTTAILTVNNSWGDPNAIEDWVFIELRKGLPGATTVAHTQAALLQFDGDIVDTDGISPVPFPTALPDKYYVTIRHRNHLGFRTANLIDLTPNTVLNLTNNTVPLYGATPQIQLSPTIYAMNAGDSNSDGSIDAFDTILWQIFNGTFGNYQDTSDYNLDGSVDAFDSIFWEINNGKFAEYE